MSKVTAAIVALSLTLLPAIALASSVRLHNRDRQTYKLYVKHQGSAVHTSIGSSTVTTICSGPCTIRLKDTGSSIQAKAGDLITIQRGKLRRGR